MTLSEFFFTPSLAAVSLVAAASGLIGAFALMKKMTLASDAISHVALPGLGIAFLLKIHPLLGGFAALLLGAFLVWAIEEKTRIATETIIGVIFSASLAIGALLTPQEELIETLFGDFSPVGAGEALIGGFMAAIIVAAVLFLKDRLTLAVVSPDLGRTVGINVRLTNLFFLIIFSLNVLLGLEFLGGLLMGSLVIVPAAAAKNLAWSLRSDLWLSVLISLFSVHSGLLVAQLTDLPTGPVIISAASLLFFVSMLFRRQR